MMTALEAYAQARRDAERADEAVEWFRKHYGELSFDQVQGVKLLVIDILYTNHIAKGDLPPRR